jgi:TetR/AcrR family transcriptional regulator
MEFNSETEQKILQAATEVFLEHGRDGARTEEIARVAGINKALLHYYFRSKEKLYQEVLNRQVKKVISDLFASLQPDTDMPSFLQEFISSYIDRLQQNPQVVRFMLWEMRSDASGLQKLLSEIASDQNSPSPHSLVKRIQNGVKNKEIRPVEPHQLVFSLIAMCIYTFVAAPLIGSIFPDININDPSFLKRRKKEIYNLVWNGVKP